MKKYSYNIKTELFMVERRDYHRIYIYYIVLHSYKGNIERRVDIFLWEKFLNSGRNFFCRLVDKVKPHFF